MKSDKNSGYKKLVITPISLREANSFVESHHRHHKKVIGAKFSIAVSDAEKNEVCGVAIIGRPVSRILDDGWTLEVNRVCTDGTRNACSMLYGAAWKAAKSLGYTKLITYTMLTESGGSLRGAGWICIGERGGGQWNKPSRPRIETPAELSCKKLRWEICDYAPRT